MNSQQPLGCNEEWGVCSHPKAISLPYSSHTVNLTHPPFPSCLALQFLQLLPLSVVLPDSRGARHSRGDAVGNADTEHADVVGHHAVRCVNASLICHPYLARVRGHPTALERREGDMTVGPA
jgi:hypothetical protein